MKNQQPHQHDESSEDRPLPMMDLILDSVAAPVFVLRGRHILHANPAALELTGRGRRELIQSDFNLLFNHKNDDQQARLSACLDAAIRLGQADCESVLQERVQNGADRQRRVRLSFRPVDSRSVVSFHRPVDDENLPIPQTGQVLDPFLMITVTEIQPVSEESPITDHLPDGRSSAALDNVSAEGLTRGISPSEASLPPEFQHQRDLLETIFAADPGALAVVSGPDLIFRSANPAYLDLIPEPGSDPIGKPYTTIWSGAHHSERFQAIRQVIDTGIPADDDQVETIYPDGLRRYLSFRVRPLVWNGEPGALLVVWDLSDLESAH